MVDPDSGDNGEFTCSLTDNHFALEQMYAGEYKIINLTPLDRETRQTYNLQVTCEDNGDSPQFAIKNLQVGSAVAILLLFYLFDLSKSVKMIPNGYIRC